MYDKLTPKIIRKAIKILRKYKVKKPYWVEIENPIEKGDPLEGVLITDFKNNKPLIAEFGGVRFIVK